MENFRAVISMLTRGQQDTLCAHSQCTGIGAVCKHCQCCTGRVGRVIADAHKQHEQDLHTWRKLGSMSIPKNLVKNALRRCCDLPSNKDSSADTRIMSSSTAPINAAHSLGTMGARCNAAGSARTCNTGSPESSRTALEQELQNRDLLCNLLTELIRWPD